MLGYFDSGNDETFTFPEGLGRRLNSFLALLLKFPEFDGISIAA